MKCPERANLQRQEIDQGLPGAEGTGKRGRLPNAQGVLFWTNENVLESRWRQWWSHNFGSAPNAPGLFSP